MKNTVVTFKEMKQKGEKISMLTGYDYSTAKLLDEGGINGILVGDSLGNVMLAICHLCHIKQVYMMQS